MVSGSPRRWATSWILRVIYESNGFGIAVADEEVARTRAEVALIDGMLLSPEGAACVAAWDQSVRDGRIGRGERAVVFNTGTGLRTGMPSVASLPQAVAQAESGTARPVSAGGTPVAR